MEINVRVDRGIGARPRPRVVWLRGVVEQVLTAEGVGADTEISLVITTQPRVQELNRSYRGIDAPTDVLSFSMSASAGGADSAFVAPPDGVLHLGEVIISYPQAVRQAEERHHSVKKEIALLIAHGVLHLLGYDHEKPGDKRRMRAREKAILSGIDTD